MVNRCVAGDCSNTARPGVSLYKFPKDSALRRQWKKQVQRTRSKWKATESSFLCSEHFTPDCFDERAKLAAEYGIVWKRPLLPSRGNSRKVVRGELNFSAGLPAYIYVNAAYFLRYNYSAVYYGRVYQIIILRKISGNYCACAQVPLQCASSLFRRPGDK